MTAAISSTRRRPLSTATAAGTTAAAPATTVPMTTVATTDAATTAAAGMGGAMTAPGAIGTAIAAAGTASTSARVVATIATGAVATETATTIEPVRPEPGLAEQEVSLASAVGDGERPGPRETHAPGGVERHRPFALALRRSARFGAKRTDPPASRRGAHLPGLVISPPRVVRDGAAPDRRSGRAGDAAELLRARCV